MAYTTLWEKNSVTWKFFGNVKADELMRSNMEIYGDPRFDDLHYQIVDLRDIYSLQEVSPERSLAVVQEVASCDAAAARSNPNIKVAIIADGETLEALASLYSFELSESPWQVKIFPTMADARAWASVREIQHYAYST